MKQKKTSAFLDSEEKEIIESFESWEWVSVRNIEERKKELDEYAKYTISKKKALNIRLLESDIYKIKAKAIEDGMPYQTLLASVIHKYANDRLVAK